jgi:hypothetical protein
MKNDSDKDSGGNGPKVNDQLWFDISKEMVQKSHVNLNNAADKLQTLVAWLWTIYTAAAAIGLALAKLLYPNWVIILIASPSIFLIAAYFLTAMVYSPTKIEFEVRTPEDIRKEFNRVSDRKFQFYFFALLNAIIATVLVATALVVASVIKQPITSYFQANLHKQELAVGGQIGSSTTNYVIKIKGASIDIEVPEVTLATGEIDAIVALDDQPDSLDVGIQWSDSDNVTHLLQRMVTAK